MVFPSQILSPILPRPQVLGKDDPDYTLIISMARWADSLNQWDISTDPTPLLPIDFHSPAVYDAIEVALTRCG
jgi:hypothetical protein